MQNQGWMLFQKYRFGNGDAYTRLTQWLYSVFSNTFHPKGYWYTREHGLFELFSTESATSTTLYTAIKVGIYIGFFITFLFLMYKAALYLFGDKKIVRKVVVDDRSKTSPNVQNDSARDALEYVSGKSEDKDEDVKVVDSANKDVKIVNPLPTDTCGICVSDGYKLFEFRYPSASDTSKPLQVYLSGCFCDWTSKILMTRRPVSHDFAVTLFLPKGHHEFKFFVKNEWKLNKDYSRCKNQNGKENNCINL